MRPPTIRAGTALAATLLSACSDSIVSARDDALDIECSIPVADVFQGARRGTIPALTHPTLAQWGEEGTAYLQPEDRVVGVVLDGGAIAVPLRILWWHEIVNLDGVDRSIAVTHCPLTGSTLVFDRGGADGALFEVSGLLYENNLIMADRSEGAESLWPQMARGARCGPRDGTALSMVPAVEMTWAGWRALHPDSRVVTSETGFVRDYSEYPYGDYEEPDNGYTLFPVSSSIDGRRPPKERAIGIPDGDGGVVFPFGALAEVGTGAAVHGTTAAGDFVVLWDGDVGGAAAFRPVLDAQDLRFYSVDGRFFDEETDSEWGLNGVAKSGPLAGSTLEPVENAFVAFWFAWPVFYPALELWEGP